MSSVGVMYETGVLVENPTMGAAFFRKRMGYNNPNKYATAVVAYSQYGNQGQWRGQTFDKRVLEAGVHSGEGPGQDVMTSVYQARAMDPKWPARATNRMDMINPSWQANVSQYGGHSGTIEMLAGGYNTILPMANDSLEQIAANAIDENKRHAMHDPLSNYYAARALGVEETLANARAADRLAEHNAKQTALRTDQVITDESGRIISREKRLGTRKPHASIKTSITPHSNMYRGGMNPLHRKGHFHMVSQHVKSIAGGPTGPPGTTGGGGGGKPIGSNFNNNYGSGGAGASYKTPTTHSKSSSSSLGSIIVRASGGSQDHSMEFATALFGSDSPENSGGSYADGTHSEHRKMSKVLQSEIITRSLTKKQILRPNPKPEYKYNCHKF